MHSLMKCQAWKFQIDKKNSFRTVGISEALRSISIQIAITSEQATVRIQFQFFLQKKNLKSHCFSFTHMLSLRMRSSINSNWLKLLPFSDSGESWQDFIHMGHINLILSWNERKAQRDFITRNTIRNVKRYAVHSWNLT